MRRRGGRDRPRWEDCTAYVLVANATASEPSLHYYPATLIPEEYGGAGLGLNAGELMLVELDCNGIRSLVMQGNRSLSATG